ncbi:MAG: cytochrome P450 [Acidimicrobiales bacterium]
MDIDLLSVDAYAGTQPHDQFDWLRHNDPVHRHPEPNGPGFWALTRYDDIQTVGADARRFSSAPGILAEDPPQGDGLPTDDRHVMMLLTDPPLHTRMRRLVSHRFTPQAVAAMRSGVTQVAVQIVDEVVERGECDLVTEMAAEMPTHVIANLLGMPVEELRSLYALTETLHTAEHLVGRDAQQEALGQVHDASRRLYAEKRAHPADDLASLLANGAVDGRPIDETDFFLWFLLLVEGGGDTTRNVICVGINALFDHPDQMVRLRTDVDGLLPTAVEELLRWVSPVTHMRRTATVNTEIGGQPIPAGDKVVMYYGAANRDPDVFDQPHQLDIGRTPNQHVAFGGGGPHFCLGANLARIEISILLREILTRLEDLEPAGEPTWIRSNFIFGATHLPVSFKPGARVNR